MFVTNLIIGKVWIATESPFSVYVVLRSANPNYNYSIFGSNYLVKVQAKSNTKELDAYAKAANVVEEVLGAVRTVFAFGGEKIEVQRYKKHLEPAKQASNSKGISSSISDGITRVLFFGCCAVSFWFGVRWILDDRDNVNKAYTPASMIIVSQREKNWKTTPKNNIMNTFANYQFP